MVFLFQVVELVQSVVDDIQLVGVEIHLFHLTADFLRDIFQFDIRAVHPFHQFPGIGQHLLNLSDG